MRFERNVIQYGNSVGITIPVDLAKYLGLKPNDSIIIKDDIGKHGKFIAIWKKEE